MRYLTNSCVLQGVTFRLQPGEITGAITPSIYDLNPVDEAPRSPGDVLYCAGHTPLRGGKKLYVGGAWYRNLSNAYEKEFGTSYARVYDPDTGRFTRLPGDNPFGTAWYPTVSRLPDGRVLVTRGFSAFCDSGCEASDVAYFYQDRWEANQTNIWRYLLNATAGESTSLINPGIKDYTRIVVLPQPVVVDGLLRQVVMHGMAGRMVFMNTDENVNKSRIFALKPNGNRPTAWGTPCSDASSSAFIAETGEIMLMGGCSMSRIDLYNPVTDTWRTLDTGIPRNTPSTILLPDGTVLILNGENPNLDQMSGDGQAGDPRYWQIFDPVAFTIRTIAQREPEGQFRGYHNMAGLLKDGRILLSGGVHSRGDIGCEQSSLRIFNPPYLNATTGARPIIQSPTAAEPWSYYIVNDTITISYANGPLRASGGVVLLGIMAFTHSYGQNQRSTTDTHSA